jgi:hypothetical protein
MIKMMGLKLPGYHQSANHDGLRCTVIKRRFTNRAGSTKHKRSGSLRWKKMEMANDRCAGLKYFSI